MKALGIITFEDNSAVIKGLDDPRPVPAIAFLGRYRIIDFVLSNMTNSGIDNVQVYCKEKPRNLIEHLGSGTNYNINSKRGKLRVLYGEKTFTSPIYNTDVQNILLNRQYIEEDKNEYIIMAPSYFIYSLDYNYVLDAHKESGADITMVYTQVDTAKDSFIGCDVITTDRDKNVTSIDKNRGTAKDKKISLECYVMTKAVFLKLVEEAKKTSEIYWFKNILADYISGPEAGKLTIKGYAIKGFVACINSLQEYYKVSMSLRDRSTASGLFKAGWPVYTQTNDSEPTFYSENSKVTGSIVANGSSIKGTVKNSIISRGVTIGEGAVVENSIILPHSYIGAGSELNCVVVDKYAHIHHMKKLAGSPDDPLVIERKANI